MSTDAVERRLAAILSADVVGYSRLMAEDEDATIRTLADYRDEVRRLLAEYRGALADFTGDNFLASFPSAVDAMGCAMQIQAAIASRNEALAPSRRLYFRMGLNLGEIRVEGERLFGTGVNVAARLEALADPGGICVSEKVYDEVEGRLDVDLEDLGQRHVKNIPRPVRVYKVSASTSPRIASPETLEPQAQLSIAVLPFANMSTDPEQEYFCDGMAEEIINVLSQLRGLRVAARTSAFQFKGQDIDVRKIGHALGVSHILEGSVRKAGPQLRVTAQLINIADGYHLWSERYDRELGDVFAIQDDIASSIAGRLQIALSSSTSRPVVRPPTSNIEAYDLFLKGRHLIAQRGEDILKGLEFMDRAIQLDSGFATAYAAIAQALTLLVVYGALRPRDVMPKAKAAAEKALELNAELAEVRNAVALIRVAYDWDWDAAESEFTQTLELEPDHSAAHYWFGLLYHQFAPLDSEKALSHARRALELDPLATLPAYALGLVQISNGLYDEAVENAESALARDPAASLLRLIKGVACRSLNRHDEAIEELEKGVELSARSATIMADLGAAYVAAGRPEDARRSQAELEGRFEDGWISPTMLAITPSALGDLDHSAMYLELAFEERDPLLSIVRSWPSLGNVSQHPRALAVVRRMCFDGEG